MAETETILLNRFAHSGDAEAFAEIIRRYAGLVYSAALRVLADVDRASDVAQDTFLQLAKDAGNVTGSLPGWLHRVATHKAIDQVRRESARKHREAEYVASQSADTADWKEISPYVDEGLNLLDPRLRTILIAHFLEGRTTREIARAQGLSQATISRRIETGVELLRARLRRRGILVAAGALAILLGENAVQAAPSALLTELGKIALVSGSLAASGAAAGATSGSGALATSILTMVKANAAVVTAAAVVVVGAGSVLTYRHMRRPAAEVSPAPVVSVTQDAIGSISQGDASAGRRRPGRNSQEVPAAGPDGEVSRSGRYSVLQGLPGPEAETDPRTYVPSIASAYKAAESAVPSEEAAFDQAPPVEDTNVNSSPREPTGGNEPEAATLPSRESPYELVMRLRRETMAGKPELPGDPNLPTAVSVGPVVARADLTLSPPFRGSPVGVLGFQRQNTTVVRPAHVVETPPDAPRDPVYFAVDAGTRTIHGVTYRSIRMPGDVMLYLDTDGDGRWSDERAYVGRRILSLPVNATYEFGPVYLKQGGCEPGGDAFYVQCTNGRWLTFWPAFYRDGAVVLNGRTYRISLVDSDFDGRFNEAFTPAADGRSLAGDVLAIDLNGDSQFMVRPLDEPEVLPLGKLVRIAGQYYAIEVAEDGGTIEFRQAQPFGSARP
jgi:RNA polymerase sigma factor (sigma-70 family)